MSPLGPNKTETINRFLINLGQKFQVCLIEYSKFKVKGQVTMRTKFLIRCS